MTGALEREAFLTALAVKSQRRVVHTEPRAEGIVFLYRQILGKGSGWLEGIDRAKEPARRPVVFTRYEERTVLARLDGVRCVMASRLPGFGLWLMEYAGCASGTSVGNKTSPRDPGFDFKLLSC